jgi:diguanylate cyclase (GGDEF)-like protein/PAS domain S-box-containing protein
MLEIRRTLENNQELPIRLGAAYAAISALAIFGYYTLSGSRQEVAYDLFGFFAIACILLGIRINRPSWPLPWLLIASGILVLKIGDLVYTYHVNIFGSEAPYPSLADGLYFIGNTIIFCALLIVLRAREPHQDTGNAIDAAIIATTAAALFWIFLMAPYANDKSLSLIQRLAAVATPIYDLITIVLITRLIFGTGLRTPSFYLLLGGMASCLIADVVYSELVLHTTFQTGALIDIGWILWFLLYAAAALHPSMAQIGAAGEHHPDRLSRGRLFLLTAAVLLVPAVTLFEWIRDKSIDVPVVLGASGVAFVLVVLRMTGLVHTAEAARRDLGRSLGREQVMRQASLSLVSASSRNDVYQSAAGAIGTLISDRAEGRVLHVDDDGNYEVVAATNHRDIPVMGKTVPRTSVPDSALEQLNRGTPRILNKGEHRKLWTQLNLDDAHSVLVLSPVMSDYRQVAALGLAVSSSESADATSLLTALCSQVSLALERVSLSDQLHLRRSEERFHSLVQHSSDVILILTTEGVISYASPSVRRVFGVPEVALVGTDLFGWVHVDDFLKARSFFADVVSRPGSIVQTDVRIRGGKQDWRSVEITCNNLLEDPGLRGIVVNARDVSERKLAEERLSYQAWHDPLTNLPNRARFMEELGKEIIRTHDSDTSTAILFIDLDRFKLVNDSLGHDAGDTLLREAGRRITNGVRPDDMVARLGGDEFTVMMTGIADISEPRSVARRLLDAFSRPLLVGDREVFVDASIGISMVTEEVNDPGELLRRADIAMYQAKDMGGQSVAVFDDIMGSSLLMRLEMETELRHAIERGQLVLHYQPEIDLTTSQVIAAEALVRWNHPELGAISPVAFIPLAEETGLILEIGRWVMAEAARTAARWIREMPGLELTMSVNLSVRQYLHPGIVDEVAAVLNSTGLPANRLRLEITETILMDEKASSRAVLDQLDTLGVQLAIDDFGSGYSNLGYLKRLPVETLKIDQIFIKGLGHDRHDKAIVSAITTLAHEIGLLVTAEGVETIEQMQQVRDIGCDYAQGYYFARPMSAADMTLKLREHYATPARALAHPVPVHAHRTPN